MAVRSRFTASPATARLTRRLGLSAVAFLFLVLGTRGLEAQVELQGRVLDDVTEGPISNAQVILEDEEGAALDTVITDETGHFRFRLSRNIPVRLSASRLGYESNTTPILRTDDHGHFGLEFRLHPDAVLLAPLTVLVRSPHATNPVLANFHARVERNAPGVYFTEEEIEKRNASSLSDVVAMVPGVRVMRSGRGIGRAQVTMARSVAGVGGRSCPVQIFLDGTLFNRMGGVALDEVVSPRQVTGIEVHRGLSSVPAEFLNENARCGVIAIWTKRYRR